MQNMFVTPDRYPCTPLDLFNFADNTHDAFDAQNVTSKDNDGWRISDDKVIGGFSESKATFITPQTSESFSQDFESFLRWEGKIDTTVGLQSSAQRSGFAALRSPTFPFDGANLRGLYSALEIFCRSRTDRVFRVNLRVATPIPDDIYQVQIAPKALSGSQFDRIVVPFSEFRVTSRGREREIDRILDGNICIENIGISLMDGKDGDFQFDLAKIRCVNFHEGKVFESQTTA